MTGLAATVLVAVPALAVANVLVANQRDRAEKNLAFARRVVDEMYTGVAENLDDQKEMDDYQREILEKALRFYERFALPQSDDPQLRLEAARAGLRAGGIRSRLGNTVAAEQAYRQTLGVLHRLVTDHPAAPDYRAALAQAHYELCAVFRDELRWSECEREFNAAAALWDVLAREQPKLAEYRAKRADALSRLGALYKDQSRLEESHAALRQALEIAEALAREHPEVSAYQWSLATVLKDFAKVQCIKLLDYSGSIRLAQRGMEIMGKLARDHPDMTKYELGLGAQLDTLAYVFIRAGKLPQAEAAVKRSLTILEKLAADHPQDMKIAADLAYLYLTMSQVVAYQGQSEAAVKWLGRYIQALRLVARRDPGNLLIARSRLAAAIAEKGERLTRLGRLTEALADFNEAVELAHKDGTKAEDLFRVFHALTNARLGNRSELAVLGHRVRDIVKAGTYQANNNPYRYLIYSYDAACVHAVLAQLALEDQRKLLAERQQLADRELERALELLDTARADGEFNGPIHLDEARRDSTLDPLRLNPRFQLLSMDLAFPDNPFGSERGAP
jgi:tetratricopeptide (TPR) repeat protein